MAHILITSGPTREYLDPVRYLTNASSGRMGAALAAAAIELGHRVSIVSGPVETVYPSEAEVIAVTTTEQMAHECLRLFPRCDGMIAAAAPCDYRPKTVAQRKLQKTGDGLMLELVETTDIVAAVAAERHEQWIVAFALETHEAHAHALEKLRRKNCDLICVNGPSAIQSSATEVTILDRSGTAIVQLTGQKTEVARGILEVIEQRLVESRR